MRSGTMYIRTPTYETVSVVPTKQTSVDRIFPAVDADVEILLTLALETSGPASVENSFTDVSAEVGRA